MQLGNGKASCGIGFHPTADGIVFSRMSWFAASVFAYGYPNLIYNCTAFNQPAGTLLKKLDLTVVVPLLVTFWLNATVSLVTQKLTAGS